MKMMQDGKVLIIDAKEREERKGEKNAFFCMQKNEREMVRLIEANQLIVAFRIKGFDEPVKGLHITVC